MRVLMIAPPGAGKGTQGALIAAHFGIPHIATGELLRDHVARRTDLGLAVQEYLDRGWYRDRGILVSVDAMRPAQQVGREILTALEAMRPLLDHGPAQARHPVDLTTLGEAFGVTGPVRTSLSRVHAATSTGPSARSTASTSSADACGRRRSAPTAVARTPLRRPGRQSFRRRRRGRCRPRPRRQARCFRYLT